jgi:hypothetical protein
VPEALWVARLIISEAMRTKLSSLHRLNADEVRDAVICMTPEEAERFYEADEDPEKIFAAFDAPQKDSAWVVRAYAHTASSR